MMLFNDFVHKYKLKKKATSIIKVYQIFSSLPLSDVGNYLGDGLFSKDLGIVNLHPSKGTHWVAYKNESSILIVMVLLLLKNYLVLI